MKQSNPPSGKLLNTWFVFIFCNRRTSSPSCFIFLCSQCCWVGSWSDCVASPDDGGNTAWRRPCYRLAIDFSVVLCPNEAKREDAVGTFLLDKLVGFVFNPIFLQKAFEKYIFLVEKCKNVLYFSRCFIKHWHFSSQWKPFEFTFEPFFLDFGSQCCQSALNSASIIDKEGFQHLSAF